MYYNKDKYSKIQVNLIKCLGNIWGKNKQQKDLPNNLSQCQDLINSYYSCIQKNSIILSLNRNSS